MDKQLSNEERTVAALEQLVKDSGRAMVQRGVIQFTLVVIIFQLTGIAWILKGV